MSANPKKARVAVDDDGMVNDGGDVRLRAKPQNRKTFKDYVLQSEIWSLCVSITMQDGPFLTVRLYVVIELGVIDSSTVFFVLKNVIVILLLAYRLIVVALLMSENSEDNEAIDSAHKVTSKTVGIAATNGSPGAKSPLKKRSGTYNVRPKMNGSTPSIPASTASNKSRVKLSKVTPVENA